MHNQSSVARPNGTLTAVPISPTDEAISQIAAEQQSTHELVSRLVDRLEKVLAPSDDSKLGGDPLPCPTALASALEDRRQDTIVINQRLQNLLNRIVL